MMRGIMGRVVQKFGGTSVKDVEHIRSVAKLVAKAYHEGNQVVTVVSAMGHTTDHLVAMADDINPDASEREMDMLLATGEQVSIALLSMAVQALGLKVRSFTGAQAGIITDPSHGSARIKEIRTDNLEATLGRGEVAIVAGFQGVTESNEICTLGRGGSDYTAVALAAALRSETCDIYTDVNGVYTADPRSYSGARKLEVISFEEMLELASAGAQVLNARSVELGMNMQVPIRLRSTFEPDDFGTLITHKHLAPDYVVCGIACDTSRVAFTIELPLKHNLESISRLFHSLHSQGIATDMVTLLGRDDKTAPELMFTVEKRAARKVEQAIAELKEDLGRPQVKSDADIARISVVGSGLSCRRGVVAAIFDELCGASIPVQMLTTGDIRVTALVPARYKNEAIERIHERFCIYPPVDSLTVVPESRIA
jgi:aspartate kinase